MGGKQQKKKKKDPNAPKQPLSAYSICKVAKELGRRWADMDVEIKQRYLQMAEEGRRKYAQDMATYRQGLNPPLEAMPSLSSTSTKVTPNRLIRERKLESAPLPKLDRGKQQKKKKKDPNAPKQPLSAYIIFTQEERL